ncbi:MAG: NAD(P)-dependent glycerol-3-phosphate dehydrogenase [Planctomycetes bacterium]|nr:NAD(P)-dependent glycerol-3-phosphate dehydrogenase [Planctomycetota bacterium]
MTDHRVSFAPFGPEPTDETLDHHSVWGHDPRHLAELRRRRENRRYLRGVPLPGGIRWTGDAAEAASGAHLAVLAIPVQFARGALAPFRGVLAAGVPVVSAAKGIEKKTSETPTRIVQGVLGSRRTAVLSGPSHAEEVARGLPATVVVASRSGTVARQVQSAFHGGSLRVYTSRDVAGVELAGALKNVIAIGGGICDGLGLGDNAKAALVTRGLAEIARLGVACGARRETFFGLAGIGDLLTTCYSPYGRNRAVGIRLGRGETLKAILASMEQVAEGVWTTAAARSLARSRGIEMPVVDEMYAILYRGKSPREAVRDLMRRAPRAE